MIHHQLSSQAEGDGGFDMVWNGPILRENGAVNEFERFQDTRRDHLPELRSVLMHTESVHRVSWVFLVCEAERGGVQRWLVVASQQEGSREIF